MKTFHSSRGFSIGMVISTLALFLVLGAIIHTYRAYHEIDDDIVLLEELSQMIKSFEGLQEADSLPTATSTTASTTSDATVGLNGFLDYDPDIVPASAGKKVVLYFHAAWSESSRSLVMDIETNRDQIPDDVVILKTDFDRRLTLREKYGVETENTFVQIESSGVMVKKWIGSDSLEEIIAELK